MVPTRQRSLCVSLKPSAMIMAQERSISPVPHAPLHPTSNGLTQNGVQSILTGMSATHACKLIFSLLLTHSSGRALSPLYLAHALRGEKTRYGFILTHSSLTSCHSTGTTRATSYTRSSLRHASAVLRATTMSVCPTSWRGLTSWQR